MTLRRTRVLHSLLTHYLPIYFPEMERYFHASRAQWLARTLTRFPTPRSMTRYDLETFVEQAWTVVGRKVNKRDWLTELYEVAQNSIGLPIQENSLAVASFRLVLQEFLHLYDLRQKIESMAEGTLETRTDYQRLKTLSGVGPILAMTLDRGGAVCGAAGQRAGLSALDRGHSAGREAVERVRELYDRVRTAVDEGLAGVVRAVRAGAAAARRAGRDLAAAGRSLGAAGHAAKRTSDTLGPGLQDAGRDVTRALDLMRQRGRERDYGPSR